ncbi:MAG: hypothetical protein GF330_07520 [Candidatus Eisenbacteria bacterium]|nr:hypothetical protein [Candidatus Eisenbacteria bacterium]
MLLGLPDHWLTYLYQFGVGGIFFLAGLLVIIKTGACDLRIRADRIWFSALIIGFVGLATVYALWILAAVSIPTIATGTPLG